MQGGFEGPTSEKVLVDLVVERNRAAAIENHGQGRHVQFPRQLGGTSEHLFCKFVKNFLLWKFTSCRLA